MADEKTYLYSIGKNPTSGEFHVFRAYYRTDENKQQRCTSVDSDSICGGLKVSDVSTWPHNCMNEDTARQTAVGFKRTICGTCVSDLYLTKK